MYNIKFDDLTDFKRINEDRISKLIKIKKNYCAIVY